MKETTGELNMVIITIILVGLILIVARPMISTAMDKLNNRFQNQIDNADKDLNKTN